jgi:hypothetical protein
MSTFDPRVMLRKFTLLAPLPGVGKQIKCEEKNF